MEVNKQSDLQLVKSILINNGWLCMNQTETSITLNKGYTEQGFSERVFHLHIRIAGDNDELFFRDYLIEHKEIAKEYETLKLSLWKEYEHDRDRYTDAKTDLSVEEISYSCGYDNVNKFINSFKKKYEKKPGKISC